MYNPIYYNISCAQLKKNTFKRDDIKSLCPIYLGCRRPAKELILKDASEFPCQRGASVPQSFFRSRKFLRENYVISDAPLDVGSDGVSSRTAKKSAQRGLTASNEHRFESVVLVQDGITLGGQWFRQNTMHYLNFKSHPLKVLP